MFNFLHTANPEQILFSLGPIKVYWYGLCLVLGIVAALAVTKYLAKLQQISQETVDDLSFWLIINSIIGARIYDVLLEHQYYAQHPLDVLKIWQGGLAIHGAIIAGAATIFWYCRKNKLNFWQFAGLIVPGLALGQAIGRWGNYFNQELFGQPTNLPWGIPIDIFSRPAQFLNNEYFHPTFLYESLGSLAIFALLLYLTLYTVKNRKDALLRTATSKFLVLAYLFLYSLLRFSLEFIRIDFAPTLFGWRWPQLVSLAAFHVAMIIMLKNYFKKPPAALDQPD
ncbi:prolipoprotein diacylglyceryl transferase [Candidatus Falkowbacteria bacterium]|nr:prolipoprotein diacylglyceryl transferase [Candidatus Falkowbacteria bacterium]